MTVAARPVSLVSDTGRVPRGGVGGVFSRLRGRRGAAITTNSKAPKTGVESGPRRPGSWRVKG